MIERYDGQKNMVAGKKSCGYDNMIVEKERAN